MKPSKLLGIRIAILGLWALALASIVIIAGPDQVLGSYRSLTPQGIKDTISSFGALSVLAFLLASLARPFLLLPVSPFTMASGFMFGMWWGLLWSLTGSTLSAILIFFLSRCILRDFVVNRLLNRYHAIDKMLADRGWSFVFFLRVIPVLPYDLVSCLAGASGMRFRDYLLGTIIGEMPGAVVLVMLGTSLGDARSDLFYLSIMLAIVVFGGTELLRRWLYRRRRELKE